MGKHPVIFLTLKNIKGPDWETCLDKLKSALKQIAEKKYETELMQREVKNIKKLAVVFEGKEVIVREG